MKKSHLITGAIVAAFALCGTLTTSAAPQDEASPSPGASGSSATATSSDSPAVKAPRATSFRGSIASVDESAKTFTMSGKKARVIKVTDKTSVTKDGETATFADIAADQKVTGSGWKQEDGTFEAKMVKIGGPSETDKASSRKKAKKGDAAATEASATPTASASPRR